MKRGSQLILMHKLMKKEQVFTNNTNQRQNVKISLSIHYLHKIRNGLLHSAKTTV